MNYRIIIGTIKRTVTNGKYSLPTEILGDYNGDYVCISGLTNTTASVHINALSGAVFSQVSTTDFSATCNLNGDYNVNYLIIKLQ